MIQQREVLRGRGAASRGSQAYDALLDRIRTGQLPPGMRLREEDLGAALGMSRTPVREALARLQARDLVEGTPGGLAVVELTRPRIMELYAMRGMLEGSAARFAAGNASEVDLTTLNLLARRFRETEGEPAETARINAAFHEAIYEAAHNRYLVRMLADLNDSLALLPETTFSVSGRFVAAIEEHRTVLEAIEARNAAAAEAAARDHIQRALEARLEMIFSRN